MRALLGLADRWTFARSLHPSQKHALSKMSTHFQPKTLVFDRLVAFVA